MMTTDAMSRLMRENVGTIWMDMATDLLSSAMAV